MKNKLLYLLSISIFHLHGMHRMPEHYMAPGTIIEKAKTRPLDDTLLLAIARDDLDAVNNFLAAGVDVNARYHETIDIQSLFSVPRYPYNQSTIVYKRDKFNNTALMYAAEIGILSIVQRLLDAGANPTALTLCNKHIQMFLNYY